METDSGRWRVEQEMARLAMAHAAALLRSVAHDISHEQLRERLVQAAEALDREASPRP